MIGVTKQGGIQMEQTLGKRIAGHRRRLGLTQDQLAEQLGITAQAISKWENEQSCPDITMLPRLAQIFGTTTDALLGIEREPLREAELVTREPDDEPEGFHARSGDWEFHWDGGRKNSLRLAALVLLVGGLLLAGNLLNWPVSFWGLLWPSALLIFGLGGLYPRFGFFRLGCVLFGGYFLTDELRLVPDGLDGNIVFPVILLIFGLSLLADALRRPARPRFHFHHGDRNKSSSTCQISGESFVCETSFGEDSQLIELPRLSRGRAECSFGELTVDLSGCEELSDDCRVHVDCSFGSVTLLIPRRFRAALASDTCFSSVEVTGHPEENAAALSLNCDASFGSVTIRYI